MVQEEPVEDYLQDVVSGVLNTEDHKKTSQRQKKLVVLFPLIPHLLDSSQVPILYTVGRNLLRTLRDNTEELRLGRLV